MPSLAYVSWVYDRDKYVKGDIDTFTSVHKLLQSGLPDYIHCSDYLISRQRLTSGILWECMHGGGMSQALVMH